MKLMAIDGNSMLNRAFYGIRLLTNHEGLCTNAVYGFVTTMLRLQEEYQPDRIVVCFDVKEKTFRHKAYEAYKGTRKGMPEELAQQLPLIREVLTAMGIPYLEKPGYEADDLLGTLSREANERGDTCLIVTGDKDSLQLIGGGTSVLLAVTRRGQTTTTEYTTEVFREQYGFDPIHMIDLKALMGDTSDNIPGVSGIGEKTAMGLIQKFGSVQAVYDNIDDPFIKKGQRSKLLEDREGAEQGLFLVTIVRDVPLETGIGDLPPMQMDETALYNLFTRLEFKNLITRLGLQPPEEIAEAAPEKEITCKEVDADTLFAALEGKERIVLTAPHSLSALCLLTEGTAYVLRADQAGNAAWRDMLQKLFSGAYPLTVHDGKPYLLALLEEGIEPADFAFDTALGAYLLDPAESGYSLDKVAMSYLHRELPPASDYEAEDAFSPLGGSETAQQTLCAHGAAVEQLAEQIVPKIEAEGMHDLYYNIELPLEIILASMQHYGLLTNADALRSFGDKLTTRIDELTAGIYEQAGREFNINSTKMLGQILFEELELPVIKKTKTGYSTNIDVLEALKGYHPMVGMVIEYRQLTKLRSTYVDGMLKTIGADGRIHSTFQQMVTATGRLSSTDPNLQNIPVRTELGSELRHMFMAKPGCVLVDADYSQIELRVLADIADDQAMIEAFQSGVDIHAVTASQVFRVPLEEVTPQMRRSSKAVNFGIVYGISGFSLANDIGVSVKQASQYINNYLEVYHGVRDYMERIKEQAKEEGYVSTMFGRKRWLPELKSKNNNIRKLGERMALNTPIQGTAADIIKIAMVRVYRRLKAEHMRSRLILQVHDELILEAPEEEIELAKQVLKEEMEAACVLKAPLTVEAACGQDWYAAKG
ncbi:DNA polymerase I [Butyricicoccus sp.]|uniref:DNA polymerase I n=1 Tax=Butyricicoccus sp. TaxID=2049021 RepID=UPI003F1862FC